MARAGESPRIRLSPDPAELILATEWSVRKVAAVLTFLNPYLLHHVEPLLENALCLRLLLLGSNGSGAVAAHSGCLVKPHLWRF